MMRVADSVQLAGAKLRTHRVRTGVITGVAALLFAGIATVLCMLTGAARSMESFGKEGLGDRFIVQARPVYDAQVTYVGTPELLDRLRAQTNQLKAEKKAAAKRLNIAYDATNDQTLPISEFKLPDGTSQTYLNQSSPVTQGAVRDQLRAIPHLDYTSFQALARGADAKATYQSVMYSGGSPQATVSPVVNGKEQVQDQSGTTGAMGEPRGVSTLTSLGWSYFDNELLAPFLLPGQHLALGKNGEVPVIAPMSAVEQMLGLPTLPGTASTQQRLERLAQVRRDIAGQTATLCYRNTTSMERLQQAKTVAEEIARNKGKADYVAPSLQYAAPEGACGEMTVKRDVRTYEEKVQTDRELDFKRQYENYQDPQQALLTVRVVGISQDMSFQPGFSARSLMESILRSSLGQGWFSPIGAIQLDSVASNIQPGLDQASPQNQVYYAEFGDLAAAKEFAKQASCASEWMANYGPPQAGQVDKRVVDCYKAGTYFDISPFGNNASAIEDLRQGVWNVMRYVAPVVLVLASLVLMGIVGKIIADSRRETAVFRALGATRLAVAQVYLTYSMFIAAFIILLALLLGGGVAYVLSARLAPEASVAAVLAYNAQNIHKQFTFFGMDIVYVGIVVGLIVLAALLSTVLPLLTNIRRNPIRDMRDEG